MAETPEIPTRPRWRGWLQRLLPIAVGTGLIALILSRTDLARLAAILAQVQWHWYGLAQVLLVVNLLLITGRWRFNLGLLGLRYPFGPLFLVDNAGALAGAATPGRMGDLARLVYFRQEKPVLVRVGVSILVERLLDLIMLIWLATAFVWSFPLPPEFKSLWFKVFGAGHLAGAVLLAAAWMYRDKNWLPAGFLRLVPTSLKERFAGSGQEVKATLGRYVTGKLVWSFTLTLLAWWSNILSGFCSALALHLPLSLWQTGACFCLSTLFTLIPLSVAGIGTRELAMVYLFSCLGLPVEQALAFSFLLLGFLVTHSAIGFVALLLKPPSAGPAGGIASAA